MLLIGLLAVCLGAEGPAVEVSTLDGRVVTGTLRTLTATECLLDTATGEVKLPATELLELRRTTVAAGEPPATPEVTVQWAGGKLSGVKPVLTATDLTFEHPLAGAVKLDRTVLSSLRFAPEEPVIREAWQQLQTRGNKRDLLVVRKGEVLDHLDGVVAAFDAVGVKFILDGEEVAVKRERLFGIVFAQRNRPELKPAARLELVGGDTVLLKSIRWSEEAIDATPFDASAWKLPATAVSSIDFSLGKIRYLSAMEPRSVQFTPYFKAEWEIQRDRGFSGAPLTIGRRTYTRGLAIHSKTLVRYRLAGEYRRFQAVVGLDGELYSGAQYGDAHIEVRADGKTLFNRDMIAGQDPETLDLSVTGVDDLELFVDYGRDRDDIGDRVYFGDAKVVK